MHSPALNQRNDDANADRSFFGHFLRFRTPHPRERTVKEGKIETPSMFETLRKSVEMLAPAMRRR
jgi:hypothetical protein